MIANFLRQQYRMINYLKHPRIWFLILIYPVLFLLFGLLRDWFLPELLQAPFASGVLLYLVCSMTCILTIFTIVNKLFHRDLQGQKLRLREKQGIELDPK